MIWIRPMLAAALLGASLAACGNPQSAPEPENETTAATMPATPDAATGRTTAEAGQTEGTAPAAGTGVAPDTGPITGDTPTPEPAAPPGTAPPPQ